jgi:hypothetical protein
MRQNSPALAELARSRVVGPLTRWIPSVRVTAVVVNQTDETIRVSIHYDVVDPSGTKVLIAGLETSVPVG